MTTKEERVLCDECGTNCKLSYDFDEEENEIPIYAECPKCGWSVY